MKPTQMLSIASVGESSYLPINLILFFYRKKKKDKEEKELKEKLNNSADEIAKQSTGNTNALQLTKAQIAFQKQQEKIQKERILQKASMTHKQRVEEFNRHLDSLTEHFDIPKVSWTK